MNPLHNKERLSLPEAKIAVSGDPPIGPAELGRLQRETFAYFVKEANPSNGLIADKTQPGAPPSIAAVGLALSSYPVGGGRDLTMYQRTRFVSRRGPELVAPGPVTGSAG